MRLPRARYLFAGLVVPLAVLGMACAESPAPVGGASYPQASGYPQQGYPQPYGQQLYPGQTAAPSATQASAPTFAEPPPSDVPSAIAQLERAEQALSFVLRPAGDAPQVAPPQASGAPVAQGDPCLIACAALGSMRRSADHVCGMVGEGDAVCHDAKARVKRAEDRVLASCPACAASK